MVRCTSLIFSNVKGVLQSCAGKPVHYSRGEGFRGMWVGLVDVSDPQSQNPAIIPVLT